MKNKYTSICCHVMKDVHWRNYTELEDTDHGQARKQSVWVKHVKCVLAPNPPTNMGQR